MKITINNVEIELTQEQLNEIRGKVTKEGKYFFPKEGEKYYFTTSQSIVSDFNNNETGIDESYISMGVYRTKEQAQKAIDKQKALVRMWKWVQDNDMYFEPNWNDRDQYKCFINYYHLTKKWEINSFSYIRVNFLLPYFKTEKDCQAFINANLSDLNLFI